MIAGGSRPEIVLVSCIKRKQLVFSCVGFIELGGWLFFEKVDMSQKIESSKMNFGKSLPSFLNSNVIFLRREFVCINYKL